MGKSHNRPRRKADSGGRKLYVCVQGLLRGGVCVWGGEGGLSSVFFQVVKVVKGGRRKLHRAHA